ncbi:MAG: hypothetical protein ABSA76_16410 [Bacteroidales bacterium]
MRIREMDIRKKLILVGGLLTIIWGVAHLFPINSVVKGFGNISVDNANIITMEWITEGFTLIFIGLLVNVVTFVSESHDKVAKTVYLLTFIMLVAMSVLSLFTGFKIDYLPFRLCPVIFMVAGLLIVQGFFNKNL